MATKKVTIICAECSKKHDIRKSDYDRKIKNGQDKFYCSLKCFGKADYKNNPEKLDKNKGNIKLLKGYEANRLDEYSPFKYALNKARARSKERGEETDLTLEYLKEIYEKQKGLCSYTGIKMEIPRTSQDEDIKKSPTKLSLDRIHSNTGYFKGNVEFVCYCINVMKNDFSKQETIDFLKFLKNNKYNYELLEKAIKLLVNILEKNIKDDSLLNKDGDNWNVFNLKVLYNILIELKNSININN